MKHLRQTIKDIIAYLGSFPNIFSENSTKLLALLLSVLSGTFLVTIIIPFILIWDVVVNGHVVTDLVDLGILVLCIGGFICGAGYNVKIPDLKEIRKSMKKEVDEIVEANNEEEE